jgi:hypothetical protein
VRTACRRRAERGQFEVRWPSSEGPSTGLIDGGGSASLASAVILPYGAAA